MKNWEQEFDEKFLSAYGYRLSSENINWLKTFMREKLKEAVESLDVSLTPEDVESIFAKNESFSEVILDRLRSNKQEVLKNWGCEPEKAGDNE